LIKTQQDLAEVLASWGSDKEFKDHLLGIVLLMEGADPILEPKQTEEWYDQGVRIIGPAWHATRYSAGTGQAGRLTKLGHELLEVMAGLKIVLDTSHLAEQAFYEAVDRFEGAIIASHSNPRRFMDSDRNLSDTMIRQLIARDGVIGVVLYNQFLKNGWRSERDRKHEVTVQTVLDAIDHVCQLAGSTAHVGLGTDWDGGFGWESIPEPLDSHIDLWALGPSLAERYGQAASQQILSGNFLRILRQVLP
jgi:membrane dipeptidase